MHDEIDKKQVKKGPNNKVLMGVKREIGRPQPIKNGSYMKEINSCN